MATVQKELIRQVEFTDLADAQRQIRRWVRFYNYLSLSSWSTRIIPDTSVEG